jgi:hypothetical protein
MPKVKITNQDTEVRRKRKEELGISIQETGYRSQAKG